MSGCVYFIGPEALLHRKGDDELRVVKIGYTSGEPMARLSQLQTGSPVHLNIFAHIEGTIDLEKAFHRAFGDLAHTGEWFQCFFKLADFLNRVSREGKAETLVSRDELVSALRDTVFAFPDSYPEQDRIGYRDFTHPEHLAPFFPEVWK